MKIPSSLPSLIRRLAHAALALTAMTTVAAVPVPAQGASRWQEIGRTVTGNAVFVDPRTIVRDGDRVSATVRSTYGTPSMTPKGLITASRADATFDCTRKAVLVRQTTIYLDEKKGTIYERRMPQNPGYGPVFRSNFSGVALEYLCAQRP
ncbi:MAG: surface-adhesin E family protein [Gemmatimonadaceae bacterium]